MKEQIGLKNTAKKATDGPVKVSSITRRILAVNVFALAVLVFGLLYVGKYKQGLIEGEISALMTQAKMFAAALGEAAISGNNNNQYFLEKEISSQIIRRLTATTSTHAKLITKNKQVLIDSKLLVKTGGVVQVEELPPPNDKNGLTRYILNSFDQILWQFQKTATGPTSNTASKNQHTIPPEAVDAIDGEYKHAIRQTSNGYLTISVAVPVQRYKNILGAINLIKNTKAIDDAVFEVRLGILKVFGVALFVTILLSIYLARTIAQPLHRLAAAANLVRRGLSRQYSIPNLGRRSDEIGLLSAALKDMTEALWDRMDSIEQFAADVTHEIRNPLTSLRSAVETAAKLKDSKQQKKLIAIILDDIQRLDRLITDIADASRLDSELSRAMMERFDMSSLLKELREFSNNHQGGKGVTLFFDIPHNTPMIVIGIQNRIAQVLKNLLGNAESFSPQNGTITIKAEIRSGFVNVAVEDEGPGVSENALTNIFKRFYKDRPTDEKFGIHSGLGLSISKQIIETHGGKIWAKNRKSDTGNILGAQIKFTIPLVN